MKIPLVHLPLERYQSRYTANLADWELAAFSDRFAVRQIMPSSGETTQVIGTGEVLDSLRRPTFAMEQMLELLTLAPNVGKVYFSDFFHPGLEALAYSRANYKAFAYCWAQTFDQYDFTRKVHVDWMRMWELMACQIYSGVFVASSMLKDLILSAAPYLEEKIHVVGLPYSSAGVMGFLSGNWPTTRTIDLIYTSRWDTEKNPGFFLDLAEYAHSKGHTVVVCTGQPSLQGTDVQAVNRAALLEEKGVLKIFRNLSRAQYFRTLAAAQVQFNCASQDWVAFTLLDALTMGCMPLYPAIRSFPEALMYDTRVLYRPGDLGDAIEGYESLRRSPSAAIDDLRLAVLRYHDLALPTIGGMIHAA